MQEMLQIPKDVQLFSASVNPGLKFKVVYLLVCLQRFSWIFLLFLSIACMTKLLNYILAWRCFFVPSDMPY